jgi:hypothetical protein
MKFILASLLSLITLANAGFQYGCGQSDLWNQNKLACYNAYNVTAKSYRNRGCALLSTCLGNNTFANSHERNICVGDRGCEVACHIRFSDTQEFIRSHFYVVNRCLDAGFNFSTCVYVSFYV